MGISLINEPLLSYPSFPALVFLKGTNRSWFTLWVFSFPPFPFTLFLQTSTSSDAEDSARLLAHSAQLRAS